MSIHENKNRFYEISNPSNSQFIKTVESNKENEDEKKNFEENIMPENKSKIITEEGDINKPQKENIILTNEATQKDDDYLNNPLEKEENKSKGENKNNNYIKEELNEERKEELNEERKEELNEEIKEELNEEIKEETKEEVNNEKKEEIKEEKIDENNLNQVNQNEVNHNNISNILNISNTDIMNLVKSQSYLTNLPLSSDMSKHKNQTTDINLVRLKKENQKTLNNLKEKENSICLEINAIKQKKINLENISYELNGPKSIVEQNIKNNELKKLRNSENNLLEKLESVKQQIVTLLNNDKKVDRKNNIKEYVERINFLEANNYYSSTKTLETERNKYRQKQLQDLEKAKIKKENEYNKQKEEQKKLKEDFIKEFRKKEQEIIHKRKMLVDEKMKEAKKFSKNSINSDPKNYLYNRLANEYEENEKKFLQKQKYEKKKISGIEEISIVKRRIIECKYELEKRRIDKTNQMKQLWHSRSIAVAKYPSNILKQVNEYDSKKVEEEEKQKMRKIVLSKEKERYVKENVSLPPICEKLKNEREKRQISFLNMEGKERVQCIKNEIDKKIKNKYSIVEESILKKLELLKASRQKKSNSREKIFGQKLVKSASEAKIIKYNNVRNLLGESLSTKKLRMKKPNEINYLEQLRKERKIHSKNFVDWDKEIKNVKSEKGGSLEIIKKQIEYLDEKFKMEKDLIKVKGGYLNNQDLGNNMNNMIINAIRGKLAIMENLDSGDI
jgi:hypothetical protein